MPRLQTFAVTLAALACGCPTAAQAFETGRLTVSFSPYKLGRTTTIDTNISLANSNGGLPSPVTSFDTRLPPRLELVGSTLGLAVCQPAELQASGLEGCSPNARIGTGSAQVGVPFGPETVGETANVEALMGPPAGENVGVLLYAEGREPVFAESVLPGVLVLGSGPLGESLDTTVPLTPTLPGAADVSMTDMRLSLGPDHLTYYKQVHGKTVSYRPQGISLPSVCPRGGFQFVAEMSFQDGSHLTLSHRVPCPSSRRR